MRKIDQLLTEYGSSHKNETNKLIHWVCVPAIFFSLLGLIWSIPHGVLNQALGSSSPYINWASLVLLAALIYYLTISFPLFLGMVFFSVVCLLLANGLDQLGTPALWQISLAVFVIAWIGQFYGHKVEGKKPSFLKDVQFLLIGPAWLMHFIYKKLGIPY